MTDWIANNAKEFSTAINKSHNVHLIKIIQKQNRRLPDFLLFQREDTSYLSYRNSRPDSISNYHNGQPDGKSR